MKTSALLAGAAVAGLETPRVLSAAGTAKGAGAKVFKAGTGIVDITPTAPDRLKAGKVLDPLYARCLLLHDGTEQIMLIVLDTRNVRMEAADRVKTLVNEQLGIPKDRIMVSATHTHTAPAFSDPPAKGETQCTAETVVKAAVLAHKNLAPAKIGWAVGNDPKNIFCRRFLMKDGTAPFNPGMGPEHDRAMMNPGDGYPDKVSPTGPVDSLIPVISVVSPDGKPIAVFANWSCHHGSRGLKGGDISADRFGVFAEEMKRRIAEKVGKENMSDQFVAIMAQGTSGDANCHDRLNPGRKYDYKSVGRDNADAAMVVWPTIEYFDWVPLGMTERRITVPCYKPKPEHVEAAKAYLADPANKPSRILKSFITSIAKTKEWKKTTEIPLQAMRIGELGMTTLPGEFFGLTGIDLKEKSPFQPTMNLGLTNGAFSYVPPPEQYALGGYATWRSASRCLDVGVEPIVKTTLLEMLGELRDAK